MLSYPCSQHLISRISVTIFWQRCWRGKGEKTMERTNNKLCSEKVSSFLHSSLQMLLLVTCWWLAHALSVQMFSLSRIMYKMVLRALAIQMCHTWKVLWAAFETAVFLLPPTGLKQKCLTDYFRQRTSDLIRMYWISFINIVSVLELVCVLTINYKWSPVSLGWQTP